MSAQFFRCFVVFSVILLNSSLSYAGAHEFWGVRNPVHCKKQQVVKEEVSVDVNPKGGGVTDVSTYEYVDGTEVKCSGFTMTLCSGTGCVAN